MISKLNLKRPLVFFDTETTGVDIVKDRIIELCAVKIYPAKSRDMFLQRFNPGIQQLRFIWIALIISNLMRRCQIYYSLPF